MNDGNEKDIQSIITSGDQEDSDLSHGLIKSICKTKNALR